MKLIVSLELVNDEGKRAIPYYSRSWPVIMFEWNKVIRLIEETVSENTGNKESANGR